MRTTLTLIAVSLLSVSAFAAEPSCTAVAAEKKLADAQAKCDAAAAEKKLAGAAKNSNVKKCMSEAVGS